MWKQYKDLSYVVPTQLTACPGVVAAVSARHGGVSTGDFSSLNMSFSTGDDPDAVRENRRRFLQALGLSLTQLVSCSQVHGVHVEAVTEADCGRGATEKESVIAGCDVLMTNVPGVVLSMNFADCTPLWFYDPVHRAIALSHGGWRGTAQNIGAITLQAMATAYGTDPKDVYVSIGPTIRSCSFEVGRDVLQAFQRVLSGEELAAVVREAGQGTYYFNLPVAHQWILRRAGILSHHLEDMHLCTYCHDDQFFSHRKASQAGKQTGRHMAILALT